MRLPRLSLMCMTLQRPSCSAVSLPCESIAAMHDIRLCSIYQTNDVKLPRPQKGVLSMTVLWQHTMLHYHP